MVSDDIRKQLCQLAGSRKTRTKKFSTERPTDWSPFTVRDPATGEIFTEDGAWLFIIHHIENQHDMHKIELEKPPGKTGYVMVVDGFGTDEIYIKLQLGGGVVIGRSFHISKKRH